MSTWGDTAYDQNQQDIGAYNQPRTSIWDNDHDDYDYDVDQEELNAKISDSELEYRARQREVNQGWFGGDYEDYNDSRWGAGRTYDHDANGLPQAQRPGDPKIKRASFRHTDKFHKGKTKAKRKFNANKQVKRYSSAKRWWNTKKRKRKAMKKRSFWI